MRMSEKYHNNSNSDNPLTSRRTDGGKNVDNLEATSLLVWFLGKYPEISEEDCSKSIQ